MGVTPAVAPRDPRLDFFRGLAMFIILVAHTPGNTWTLWIPARFGFSDATEIFVFCSGMASAIAFGRVFDRHGLPMGTARVAHRVWQVYWAHVGVFLAVVLVCILMNQTGLSDRDQVGRLNLYPFLNNAPTQLIGLLTLTYVPNYFDILPMYLVILAMIPAVMALARLSPALAMAAVVLVWAAAQAGRWQAAGFDGFAPLAGATGFLHLPAQWWFEPPNDARRWFFNPFGWQLVFFTGFAFMRGWIPAPPVRAWLVALATVVVLANIPLSSIGVRELGFDWARTWRQDNLFLFTKTDVGVLRYVHFLAIAYLAWVAAGPHGARLTGGPLWSGFVGIVRKVGQQSLAVFVLSMVLARISGFAMEVWGMTPGVPGKDPVVVALVNIAGFGILIATAYGVAWFKGQPWRRVPEPVAAPAAGRSQVA